MVSCQLMYIMSRDYSINVHVQCISVCVCVCVCRIEGIVVAQENEEVLLEAWRQEEQIIIEKEMKVYAHHTH